VTSWKLVLRPPAKGGVEATLGCDAAEADGDGVDALRSAAPDFAGFSVDSFFPQPTPVMASNTATAMNAGIGFFIG
jgi:hypothetical protein